MHNSIILICYIFFFAFVQGVVKDPITTKSLNQVTDKVEEALSFKKKLKIPVFWQVTRSRFTTSSAATQTESFKEVWVFEQNAEGESYLISPRAKVSVFGKEVDSPKTFPSSLFLSKHDFAVLLGIFSKNSSKQIFENGKENLISINLSQEANHELDNSKDLVLHLSDEEHFEIHMEIGK